MKENTHFTKSTEILRESLRLEENTVRTYQDCITLAVQQDDTSLRLLLEELMTEAEQDVEELRKMVDEE